MKVIILHIKRVPT